MIGNPLTFFNESSVAEAEFFVATEAGNIMDFIKKAAKIENLNCVNSNGETALHIAASRGHIDVAKYLLDRGANVNAINPRGGIINRLPAVDRQAYLQTKLDTSKGQTPLHLAISAHDLPMVDLLLERGANINALDGESRPPLYYALIWNTKIMHLLLKNRADIHIIVDNISLLHHAVQMDFIKGVEALLSAGANINSADGEFRETPLHTALRLKHFVIADYLVEHHANTEIQDANGLTPLQVCPVPIRDYTDLHNRLEKLENERYGIASRSRRCSLV